MNQSCGGGVSEAVQDKLAKLIMTHKCEDLLKKQKVIQVSANMNVNEACEVTHSSLC